MIKLTCCGETYLADELHAGRKVRCWKCSRAIQIPSSLRQSDVVRPYTKDSRENRPKRANLLQQNWKLGIALSSMIIVSFAAGIGFERFRTGEGADKPSRRSLSSIRHTGSEATSTPTVGNVNAESGKSTANTDPSLSIPGGTTAVNSIRPQTGLILARARTRSGLGELRLINGSDLDACVKVQSLENRKETSWKAFLRAKENILIQKVPPGEYRVKFALGKSWNSESSQFAFDRTFFKTDDELDFQEVILPERNEIRFSRITLNLNESWAGNVRRISISEEEFDN